MTPGLDHVGLDVSDYDVSKAFYEKAPAPLGIGCIMEPVPKLGGFGADFPFVLDPDDNNIEAVFHGERG